MRFSLPPCQSLLAKGEPEPPFGVKTATPQAIYQEVTLKKIRVVIADSSTSFSKRSPIQAMRSL